jgi:hypothetical protein
VGPGAGLDDVEKTKFLTLPGLELRPLGRPARGHSLYRLRYPGSPSEQKYRYFMKTFKRETISVLAIELKVRLYKIL